MASKRRFWTDAEKNHLQQWYGKKLCAEIAAEMGRTMRQVFNMANRLGLAKSRRSNEERFGAKFKAFIREKHAAGWSDADISQAWGCERHTVGEHRVRLGLPDNSHSARVIAKISDGVKRQARRHGVASIGELRGKVLLERAEAYGWPQGLRWRATQIMNLLWERGPLSRIQIAAALGMCKGGGPNQSMRIRLNRAFYCNEPNGGGSYLANLIRRRLIVSLSKKLTQRGSGKSLTLYMIAPGVVRGPIDPELLKGDEGDQHAQGEIAQGVSGARRMDGEDAAGLVRRRERAGHDRDHEETSREGKGGRCRVDQIDHGPGCSQDAAQTGVASARSAAGERRDHLTARIQRQAHGDGRSRSKGRVTVSPG